MQVKIYKKKVYYDGSKKKNTCKNIKIDFFHSLILLYIGNQNTYNHKLFLTKKKKHDIQNVLHFAKEKKNTFF